MRTTRSQTAASRADQDAGAPLHDHQMPPISNKVFECVSCMEQYGSDAVVLEGDEMCDFCFIEGVVPDFKEALKNPNGYPVRYGGVALDISQFEKYFSPAFLAEFREKEKEYETPVPQRVYCANEMITIHDDHNEVDRCNSFLGSKSHAQSVVYCDKCKVGTCIKCAEAVKGLSWKHQCQEKVEEDPFAGLIRGVNYQTCPNPDCGLKVELRDGCNHMMCSAPGCDTGFCFICGEAVEEHDGHWRAGRPCPRFGKKDSARRIHDAPNVFQGFADGLDVINAAPLIWERLQQLNAAFLARQDPQANLGNAPDVQESPERILFNNHLRMLDIVHEHALRDIVGNPIASTAHNLTHLLEPALQIYVHQIDNPDAVPFRFIHANRDRRDDILTLIEAVDEEELFEAYPQLEDVIGGLDAAWAGELATILQ